MLAARSSVSISVFGREIASDEQKVEKIQLNRSI